MTTPKSSPAATPAPAAAAAVAEPPAPAAPEKPAVAVSPQSAGLWRQSHEVTAAGESAAERHAAALAILQQGATEDGGEPVANEAEPRPPPATGPAKTPPAKEGAQTPEVKPDAGAKPEGKEPDLAKRFDELVKAQAEARKERETLAKEREEWKRERAAPPRAKSAREALEANGYSYEDATNEVLGTNVKKGEPAPAAPEWQKKIDALESKLKGFEEQQTKARAEADRTADFATIKDYLERGGETNDLLLGLGEAAVAQIYELSVGNYNRHGEWIGGSAEMALKAAIDVVREREEKRADALLQSSWAKRKLGGAGPKPDAVRPKEPLGQKPSASRTLHNGQVAAPPPRAAAAHPSKDELRREALQVLNEGIRGESAGS